MATKKYVSLSKLESFLDNLKNTFAPISHKHTVSDFTDYTVDSELSSTSTNPVQNKVLDAEFEAISVAMDVLERSIDSKADSSHNHDDLYYTEEEIDTKLDTLSSAKKDPDLIVTYVNGSLYQVTHSSEEIYEAVNNGRTVKFQKDAELLDILESTTSFATFYIVYINMSGKLQQKIVAISGDSIALEQDDTYDYATVSALADKQDTLTGTEGQVVQINASGNAVASDLNLITVDEIDAICGGAISYAEDVMF